MTCDNGITRANSGYAVCDVCKMVAPYCQSCKDEMIARLAAENASLRRQLAMYVEERVRQVYTEAK